MAEQLANKDKKARVFDLDEMLYEARKSAAKVEYCEEIKNDSVAEENNSENNVVGLSASFLQLKSKEESEQDDDDDELIGPPPPYENKMASEEKEKQAENEEEESDEDVEFNVHNTLPLSSNVTLQHGNKIVSALALDSSGARLVSGGYDYDVKFWDFAGMNSSLHSFRTIRPCECHPIRDLKYSATGENILIIAGNAQAKVVDRDAHEIMECPKGDQYIVDMASTKGHTAMLNCGSWHPKKREEFMTCSNDGTVRLWDINQPKKHKNVIKPKSIQGRRCIPTSCAYSRDGRWVAAACQDGSVQIWDHEKMFVNVAMKNMKAHVNGTDTSCVCFSYDNLQFATRGGDDTLKLWDIRNLSKSVHVRENLSNLFPMTDCFFSPDDKFIVTGISATKDHKKGKLVFFDRITFDSHFEMEFDSSVIRCFWHPRLNQIVCGCSDGSIKIYYDDTKSQRGPKLSLAKTKPKMKQVEMMVGQNIITPHALPMFRTSKPMSTHKQEERHRKDPLKSHRPDLPVSGHGEGGRVGAHGSTLSQYVVKQLVLRKTDERDKDPRGAILRHAKEAERDPFWVAPAYQATQPKPIFQKNVESDEDTEDNMEPLWKKRRV